ncbi:lck-interacting transmembrane adapter 1 isoform X2 [Peromyscus maniculatus bairdii]|uniref:lck-interacting transmembrane adapter 1 isoform X2 n=1 Tax=Peromyscus maniculatus bairdii TaxID=230844 RepID=UPI003FD69181
MIIAYRWQIVMMRREEVNRDWEQLRKNVWLWEVLRYTGNEVRSSPAAHKDLPGCPRQGQAATSRWPWSLLPALQDEAISAFSPTSPLGHGVLLPAPLAVGTVHSLPQVCAWGSVCPPPAWLRVKSQQRSPYEGSACASTLSLGQHLITPAPSSTYWTNSTLAPRKRVQRQQTELQGSLIPVEMSLLRQTHLCSLSKSDTRLHELHQGPRCSIAPRPASMDLLHPHWLEVSRGSTRSQVTPSAFPPQQLPRAPPAALATAPSTSPEATYSNVGLAAIPRASLAASPVVWAGTQLTISCAKLGPGAEYACIQKRKETEQGYQELQQKAKVIPATQVK